VLGSGIVNTLKNESCFYGVRAEGIYGTTKVVYRQSRVEAGSNTSTVALQHDLVVQPIASRYSDYTIPSPALCVIVTAMF
jgi:hypothetical protein